MTLSIVARDTKTGDFGVCGYTDIAGYGSLVPHVSLKCAVATQAYVNVDNGIEMLELVDKKYSIKKSGEKIIGKDKNCLLYTSPSPRDRISSRMPSSA